MIGMETTDIPIVQPVNHIQIILYPHEVRPHRHVLRHVIATEMNEFIIGISHRFDLPFLILFQFDILRIAGIENRTQETVPFIDAAFEERNAAGHELEALGGPGDQVPVLLPLAPVGDDI